MNVDTAADLLPQIVTEVPGPRSRELAARLRAVECPDTTYLGEDFPVFWQRGAGANVWDEDDNRYVDLTAAFGVCALGHGHPVQRAAMRQQAERLVHAMGDVHPTRLKVEVAEELRRTAPGDLGVALFASSGSDAIESALKTCAIATGRPGAVAFEGAYHGLGYGALALTWRQHFRAPFLSQLNPDVVHLPFPRSSGPEVRGHSQRQEAAKAEDVLARLDVLLGSAAGERIGAVFVEPILGRGGVVVPAAGFLQGLREICTRRSRLLVADEILTGLGRTGRWFACEHESVVPDLLCVGKSLAGGLPLSACLGTPQVMEAWERSQGEARHTQTFLGNPLACAVARATLEILRREEWPAQIAARGAEMGTDLATALENTSGIGAIRGRGFLWGIECLTRGGKPDGARASAVVRAALGRGVILLASGDRGNVLELVPPFVLGPAQWRSARDLLGELLARIPPRA